MAFDDGYLDELIDEHSDDRTDMMLATLCWTVKFRKPPKLVYEISELTFNDSNPSEEYAVLRRGWSDKVKEFAEDEKIKIPEERWIFRDIKGPDFEKLHPFMSLAEARELRERPDPARELVKVKRRSGKITNLLEDKSSVLHYMSRLKPRLFRIYVVGIDDTKASQIRSKIENWLQS